MQPVHDHVTSAQAVHGCGQLGGKAIAVYVNDQRRLARIVQALSHANAKKRQVLPHQVGCHLILDGHQPAPALMAAAKQRLHQAGVCGADP